jgi:hypothetical protein
VTRMTPSRSLAHATAALLLLLLAATGAAAQDTTDTATDSATPAAADPSACTQPGKNVQCNGFGSITMDSQATIKGEPATLTIDIWLNSNMADQGARWILFSVRNNTSDGSPIAISLDKFATPNGDVVTTRVDHDKANEIDLWVDVLDTPVQTPITIQVQVGSSERGAYRLEALVLAFDRGYETLKGSDGTEASLFSSTLLGVNKETGALANAGGGSLLQGKKTPGLLVPGVVALLACAAVVARRRWA